MTGMSTLDDDIASLPLRIRWRYVLRPVFLRVLINRTWPGRWSAIEVEQILRRAAEDFAALRDCIE